MNMTLLANRTKEIEFFQNMVSWNIPTQILLLEASSGFGKTDLLLKFSESCTPDVIAVNVNLKSAHLGIPYVFWRIKQTLGDKYFPKFEAELQNFLCPANINIANNQVHGQMQIQIALGNNQETQKHHLMALQEQFFQDLQAVPQTIVILFDTFEQSNTEVRRWLSGDFLAAVANSDNLQVVIAGESVPERSSEWAKKSHKFHLGKIDDAQAWYEFTQEMGLNLSQETVTAFVTVFRGNPQNLKFAFEVLNNLAQYNQTM
ncbi:MAG: hypothetical protein KME23_21220 [Goleter apudmare HA4340-LM2]|jgi:hypothetical protein|nr:hypothetical protein [Goleter apudmare HA4340-LM2]